MIIYVYFFFIMIKVLSFEYCYVDWLFIFDGLFVIGGIYDKSWF